MAVVKPFAALRPNNNIVDKVVSLPYDVMNRQEAKKMAEGKELSFLHVIRSEIDLTDSTSPYSQEVYEKAATNLKIYVEKGLFKYEEKPIYFIYEQEFRGKSQKGIVACASIDDYENNIIKKHERTRVEKEKDRIDHFYACNANTEPVFLAYKKEENLKRIIDYVIRGNKAEYDFEAEYYSKTGKDTEMLRHRLWKVDDDKCISEIEECFRKIESLYIVDGHHRSASANRVGMRKRTEKAKYSGDESFNYNMAVIFSSEELFVMEYNRVVKDLNGKSEKEILEKIEERGFVIRAVSKIDAVPKSKFEFGMCIKDNWYHLTYSAEISNEIIKNLDVSVLQDNILEPILGIKDPRTDKRIDFIGGIRGID
ncbi:MAG: DUF1015 domain-containing protein, partial [Anaerovoracaceae bacterium]